MASMAPLLPREFRGEDASYEAGRRGSRSSDACSRDKLLQRAKQFRMNSILSIRGPAMHLLGCKNPIAAYFGAVTCVLALGLLFSMFRLRMTFCDSLYFMVITLSTTGYGDVSWPDNPFDRILGGMFNFVGAGLVAACIGLSMVTLSEAKNRVSHAAAMQQNVRSLNIIDSVRWRLRDFVISTVLFCMLRSWLWLMFGTIAISYIEKWKFWEGLYWACQTLSRTGYGDICPQTERGRWFTSFWLAVGYVFVMIEAASIASIPLELQKQKNVDLIIKKADQTLTYGQLTDLVWSNELNIIRSSHGCAEYSTRLSPGREETAKVSRAEFMLWVLLHQGDVTADDILVAGWLFDTYDVTRDGMLTVADVK